MLTAQRREEIKKILWERKSVTAQEMVSLFQVSGQTIRRDFDALEKEGFLCRHYGGVMLKEPKTMLVPNRYKQEMFVDAKHAIALQAAPAIVPNDCIFLDDSTTTLMLCDELTDIPLTVVTNSHSVITRLGDRPSIKLISTGGIYDRQSDGYFGVETEKYLRQHCFDKAFISSTSVDLVRGVSDSDESRASVHSAVVSNTDKVYLLADHTKLGKTGFVTVCALADVDCLITDRPVDDIWRTSLRENDVCLLDTTD